MVQSSIISGAAPQKGQIAGAIGVIVLILATGILAIPYRSVQLPINLGFMPAYGSVIGFADLTTAAFLLGQARAVQSSATARLSAAYLFSFLMVIPHLLSFPGVFAQDMIIGGFGTATWLWCAWHAGFAIFVAWFALSSKDGESPFGSVLPLFAVVVAVTLAIVLITTLGLAYLPTILIGNSYARMNEMGIGPAVLLFNVIALLLVITRLRARSTIFLWLIVAMFAACMDVALGVAGSGRFSFGWYAGRVLSVLSNTIVFIAMLFESIRVFGRVSRLNLQLEHLSLTDPLTQLPNRRAFERAFDAEWRRARRERLPISLLMVDIDQFKGFNDRLGHPAGDRCLQLVAETLQRVVRRPLDMAARLGGEEFALLLPNTEAAGAARMGEKIRSAVAKLRIQHPTASGGILTISVGVATDHPSGGALNPNALIERADAGLYLAKANGRNRVHALVAEGQAEPCALALDG